MSEAILRIPTPGWNLEEINRRIKAHNAVQPPSRQIQENGRQISIWDNIALEKGFRCRVFPI